MYRRPGPTSAQADAAAHAADVAGSAMRPPGNASRSDLLARHPVPLAGVLALATLPLHVVLPDAWSVTLASTVLVLIRGIYVGFALLDGRPAVIVPECVVPIAFAAFAAASARLAPLLLPLGYIAHGLWDAVHRAHGLDLAMPRGYYVPFCAVYDVLAGVGLWWIGSL